MPDNGDKGNGLRRVSRYIGTFSSSVVFPVYRKKEVLGTPRL